MNYYRMAKKLPEGSDKLFGKEGALNVMSFQLSDDMTIYRESLPGCREHHPHRHWKDDLKVKQLRKKAEHSGWCWLTNDLLISEETAGRLAEIKLRGVFFSPVLVENSSKQWYVIRSVIESFPLSLVIDKGVTHCPRCGLESLGRKFSGWNNLEVLPNLDLFYLNAFSFTPIVSERFAESYHQCSGESFVIIPLEMELFGRKTFA